ncbi:unnamed protein product [Chrysoparadoxa australica]
MGGPLLLPKLLCVLLMLLLTHVSSGTRHSVATEKKTSLVLECDPDPSKLLYPLDAHPSTWVSCGDAYEHTWMHPSKDKYLSCITPEERLMLARSMGYCPERRCQLGTISAASPDGLCPPGLCFTKLQNGAPTFGACCYTNYTFNSGQLIGFWHKQRPLPKPIYKRNRITLAAPAAAVAAANVAYSEEGDGVPASGKPDEESAEAFISANEIYPGIIVSQCPILGPEYSDGSVETLTDWKRMVIEQDIRVVVQLHPHVTNGSEASACAGRPEVFCKQQCRDWVGLVFRNGDALLTGGTHPVSGVVEKDYPDEGYLLFQYLINNHRVDHYWYYSWPDFGVPGQDNYDGLKAIAAAVASTVSVGGKACIVCYSGRGRSGTLAAVAIALKDGITTGLGLVRAVVRMRESRDSLVETPEQFDLVCRLLGLPVATAKGSGHFILQPTWLIGAFAAVACALIKVRNYGRKTAENGSVAKGVKAD